MDMNDEDRKLLTEFLSECWHEQDSGWIGDGIHPQSYEVFYCVKCKMEKHNIPIPQRTFATPRDMVDLKDKLVEKGMFSGLGSFLDRADTRWNTLIDEHTDDFVDWLFNAPRFCQRVADFLKKEE
jgi:hypothetical protein